MGVLIRQATSEDFADIHKLIQEFAVFIKTPDRVSITVEQMVRDQDYFKCLVATEGEQIVGFASYFFSYYSWTGKAIYLDDLYVKPDLRGQGVGSQLFDQIIEMGREEHCYKMKWQVSDWNKKAQEFYKSRGAEIDTVEINCDLIL